MTDREKVFCEEYLTDLSPKHAALRAGYAPKAAADASKWLNPNSDRYRKGLAAEVSRLMAERSKRTGINADRVLRELGKVAFADVTRAVDETSGRLRQEATEEDRAAVASIHVKQLDTGTEYDVRFWDKVKALELLGRHLGMFTDNLHVEANAPVITRNADGSITLGGDGA